MRGYKACIQEAELMAMPPDAVAEFLKRRAGQSKSELRFDQVDEDAEKALLSRGDPFVDLAVARYGRHMEAVSGLFRAAAPGSSIRLACLSNRALGGDIFLPHPTGLFGREPRAMAEWLPSASDNELSALFENPTLSDSFLRDLLERSHGWESIDDDNLCRFISILNSNPRMRTPREDDWMDGYDEYSYGSVFNAAWKLAETAPTTERWAASLGWLYDQLQPHAFSITEPLTLTARWHDDPDDAEARERQAKDHAIGYLSNKERVRKGLARLALQKNSKMLTDLLVGDDIALRAAAYASGRLSAGDLRAGYEKDGELLYNEAIRNLNLWSRQGTRQALGEIAWAVARADKHSDLIAVNIFKSMEKDMRKNHPAWFTDEEEGEVASDGDIDGQAPATKADLYDLAGHMDRASQGLESVGQALRRLSSRTGWIWWFSLGALVASLRHF